MSRDMIINNLKENLTKSEIQELVNDIVDRMDNNLKDADNKTTDIEFEISTTSEKEISKIFSLLNDMCLDKYIDYEIEDEQIYPEGKYYYAVLNRKYPDDYYFDYEDEETLWVAQPGQKTGGYKISDKSLKSHNELLLKEDKNTFTTIRNKLNRLCSPYQVQLWDNGRFEVHQVKEDDKDRLVNNLRRISKTVHVTANGKYDFSRPAMFGGLHSQYYNIYGEILMEDKNESLDNTIKHSIEVEVKSGINGDGFKVTVKDSDGHIIEKEDFSYGYNASYNKSWADKDKPFVTDIINSYLSKYNLSKDDLILTKGKNVFKDKDISDETIARFKSDYLSESVNILTEGHVELKYKGFTLDWNDDGVDPEEGIADFSVRIYFNDEEITQDAYGEELSFNGFAEAKRWIDKHAKVIEVTKEEKLDILADILNKDKNLNVWFEDANYLCIDRRDLMDGSFGLADFIIIADDNGYHLGIRSISLVDTMLLNINIEDMAKELGYDDVPSEDDADFDDFESELTSEYIMSADLFTLTFNDIDKLIEAMSNYGLTKSITELDLKLLAKNNHIYLDGKALKESYNNWELEEDMEDKASEIKYPTDIKKVLDNSNGEDLLIYTPAGLGTYHKILQWIKQNGKTVKVYKSSDEEIGRDILDILLLDSVELIGYNLTVYNHYKKAGKQVIYLPYNTPVDLNLRNKFRTIFLYGASPENGFEKIEEQFNDKQISMKEAVRKIIEKFGNHKYKYRLKAESYERYGSGNIYKKTFYAPNDYIAFFAMILHAAPNIDNLEDYFGDGEEIIEFLEAYPTIQDMYDHAASDWWGDGDDYIIELYNETTDELLYGAEEPDYTEEDDDYDWDEDDLDESFNKTYQITVKYHNEPNAKIEARSAKDRKDLEYQLNVDDEVEWYDFDEKQFNESLDQMREKALKMKENSNAFAILYGYKTKDGKEVELEPEEFATEKEYKERLQQITNSFTKLSDKDPRGNRYGKQSGIEFYTLYNRSVNEGFADRFKNTFGVGKGQAKFPKHFKNPANSGKDAARDFINEVAYMGEWSKFKTNFDGEYYIVTFPYRSLKYTYRDNSNKNLEAFIDSLYKKYDAPPKAAEYDYETAYRDRDPSYMAKMRSKLRVRESLDQNKLDKIFAPYADSKIAFKDLGSKGTQVEFVWNSQAGEFFSKKGELVGAIMGSGIDIVDTKYDKNSNKLAYLLKESMLRESNSDNEFNLEYVELPSPFENSNRYAFERYDGSKWHRGPYANKLELLLEPYYIMELFMRRYDGKNIRIVDLRDSKVVIDSKEFEKLQKQINSELKRNGSIEIDKVKRLLKSMIKKQNINGNTLTESGWAENHYMLSPVRLKKLEAIMDAGMWEDFEDAVYDASDIITGIHTDELEIENNAAKANPPYITDLDITQAKKLFYKLCDEWYSKINNKNENFDCGLNKKVTEQVNDVTEQESKLKWNIGSDKSKLSNEEIALLDELAQKLESSSANGYKYVVQHTYEDFGAGMQWYTIVCYDKSGRSWQVLTTKEWLQLMNTGDVDAVYSQVVSGEYFKDKLEESILDEMNHRQLMSYMNSLD